MDQIVSSSLAPRDAGLSSLAETLAWFDLDQTDRDRVVALAGIADEVAEQVIDAFYAHILAFGHAAELFQDEAQIARVKASQKRYFTELITAELDESYVRERRRIGHIHETAGITPTLYIGAYAFYLHRLGNLILERSEKDPAEACKLVLSLYKLAHFDMALALETYVTARERTIEAQQREMSELPTPVLKLREGLLLVPVVGALDSYRARALTVQMLEGIRDNRARAVVLDITGVAAVDSAVANHLIQTMTAARLMGASSVLTGVSAEVAQSLVKIGVSSAVLNTAGDLQSGIEAAEALLRG